MKRAIFAAVFSIGLAGAGAGAATMEAVYSGFVKRGYDATGLFTTAGADLDGLVLR